MTKALTPGEIIDALGGTSEVAALCDIKPPSVSEWRKLGIPKAQMKFLRLARPAVFQALESEGQARAGRQPPSPRNILDTVPEGGVVSAIPNSND